MTEICQEICLPDATGKTYVHVVQKEEIKKAIKLSHLKYLKETMKGEKLRRMKKSEMRERREYTELSVEVFRMAFRLETYQFDCRVNMPTRYRRDLTLPA